MTYFPKPDPDLAPVYIFDLDGTLSDASQRVHYLQNNPDAKDWNAFYQACDKDEPIWSTINILNALHDAGATVIIFTGRSDLVQGKTLEWLTRHHVRYDAMRMRVHGDHTEDHALKAEWLDSMTEADRSRIAGVFEDRARVCRMWREKGYICYHVEEGDF